MAVQDYELLLRVRADLQQALQGLGGLSTSLGEAAKQADRAGESADAATARIKAMVAATAQQAQVQESVRSTNERAAQSIRNTIKVYDDQAATVRRTQAAVDAYRATSSKQAETAAATASIAAQRAEMGKLAAQIDPTVAALAKLDAQEASLNALRKAGAVGIEDYNRFKAVIDQNRVAITGAGKAMHTFSLNTSQSRLELGRLIKDISTGQFGRLEQTSLTLAAQTGLMSALFNPLALTIAAVVGALGGFAIAAEQVALENDKLNRSIQQTGNYAGVTTGDIDKLASGITRANGSIGTSREVLNQLVASGRVGNQALGALGQAAVDMAALTGQSADKATAAVLKMFDGTAASALKANEQYHFLTTAVYDQIKALEDEGRTQEAMDVAAEAFHNAAQARIEQMTSQLSGLAAMWDQVKTSAGNAWERMKTGASLLLGTADDQTQLYSLLGKKTAAQNHEYSTAGNIRNLFAGAGLVDKFKSSFVQWTPDDEAQLQAIQARIKKATEEADNEATKTRLNDAAVNADAGLNRLASSIDKAYGKKEKIKELNRYFEQLWAGADPNNPKLAGVQRIVGDNGQASFSGGLYDTLLADINKKPKAHSTKGMESAAASARQQLIKLLNDEQGAVDPTAKAWAVYNDKVQQANELADKAKKAKGADVVAINAQRDAIVAAAAAARDAALDKIAEKDRAAFEKLRDSLKDVNGVKLGAVRAQLAELDKWLAKGVITSAEYKATLEGALNQGIKKLPSYQGVDAVVAGPFGELDKLDVQRQKLEDAYKADLDLLNQQHDAKLRSDESFIAKENELYAAHAEELRKIQDARNQVMMAGITQSFANAADAIKQAYGEQSQAYHIAFALQKSAAIAQATVAVYTAVSKAFANGVTPVDRAIYVAQALAQGMAIIADIKSVSAGYSEGGYTGDGPRNKPAGVVHAGEGVLSQPEIASIGGRNGFNALRASIKDGSFSMLRGYADGGFVNSPAASLHDFPMPSPTPALPSQPAAGSGGQGGGRGVRIINVPHPELVKDFLNSSEGEEVIMNVVGRNRTTIKTLARG